MKYISVTLLFSLVLVIMLNSSCQFGNKYPKETQMLDSMQILVMKADSAVKMMDSAKITSYSRKVMDYNQLIEMNHMDSMSAGAAAIFRDLNTIRWSLLTVAGKRGPLLNELEKSKKQLSHLSHDVSHNLVASDSIQFYVAFETKKAAELVQVSAMSADQISNQVPKYMSLTPKADSLMLLLKDHKKF